MKLLLSITLAGLSAFTIAAPAGIAAFPYQTVDAISSIRRSYQAINKRQAAFRKVRKNLSGFSTEGGQLVAYFDGKAIAKIVATYYGEMGKATEEFYYRDGKLIFVFRKDARYDRPLSGKVSATHESRFYFRDQRLIRWINEDAKEVSPASKEFREKQQEYLETSGKFTRAARTKNRTLEARNKIGPFMKPGAEDSSISNRQRQFAASGVL